MLRKVGDTALFVLSPLLCIPFILRGVLEKHSYSFFLFAFFYGIVSYLYIPLDSNDKATYYDLYSNFENYGFDTFVNYLSTNPDFIFYTLIFFFCKLGIPIDYLFFCITAFTCFVFFRFYLENINIKQLSSSESLFLFIGMIAAISLPNLFSGIRFYLAIAFVLLSYMSFYKKHLFNGIIYLSIAICTHFSCFLYVPVLLILKMIPNSYNFYKSFFAISFLFVLIPSELFVDNLDLLSTSAALSEKLGAYINEDTNLSKILASGNSNNIILYVFSNMWIFLAYIYIFSTIKRINRFRPFLFMLISTCNIFYNFPVVYNRYLLLVQFVFFVTLCYEYLEGQLSRKGLYFFVMIMFLSFVLNVYALRDQLKKSLFIPEIVSGFTLLVKESLTKDDFIWDKR